MTGRATRKSRRDAYDDYYGYGPGYYGPPPVFYGPPAYGYGPYYGRRFYRYYPYQDVTQARQRIARIMIKFHALRGRPRQIKVLAVNPG